MFLSNVLYSSIEILGLSDLYNWCSPFSAKIQTCVVPVVQNKNFPVFWHIEDVPGPTPTLIFPTEKNTKIFLDLAYVQSGLVLWSIYRGLEAYGERVASLIWRAQKYFWIFFCWWYQPRSCFRNTFDMSEDGEIFVLTHWNNT